MQLSLKNLGLLALFAVAASASSKFANTCENIGGFGSMLSAECREYENGQFRPSMINLNRCIKNHRGALQVSSLHHLLGSGAFETS